MKLPTTKPTKVVTAGEHVRFTRGEEHLEADSITINLETKAGTLTQRQRRTRTRDFSSPQRKPIEQQDGHYELKNATITTCDGPRARLDPGARPRRRRSEQARYGDGIRCSDWKTFRSSTCLTSWFRQPTGSRSTGFLIPSTSTSTTKGRSIRESFYYAINRSADATFTRRVLHASEDQREPWTFARFPTSGFENRTDNVLCQGPQGPGRPKSPYSDLRRACHRGFRGVADMNLVSSFVFRQVYEEGFNIISSPIEHSLAFADPQSAGMPASMCFTREPEFSLRTSRLWC